MNNNNNKNNYRPERTKMTIEAYKTKYNLKYSKKHKNW